MNKIYGKKEGYSPIRSDRSRLIVGYDMQPTGDGVYATWYEIYFNKKTHPVVTSEGIREAILADINARTDEKILSGFVWENNKVWLSSENQFNVKAAYDLAAQTQGASLPMKFKLGETDEGVPVYHVFDTLAEIQDFYTKAIAYINTCLNEGWQLKDSIDWDAYKVDEPKAE